jgi:flagellar hook-associated protein 2
VRQAQEKIMAISSTGIGSNLDVSGIVSKLMALEQRPLTLLQTKEATYQAKITALGTLKGAISTLQNAATSLVPATGTTALDYFSVFTATTADTTIASATTTSSAVPGSYSLSNIVLASAQQIRKSGLTVPATAGTLSIQVGTAEAVTVSIAAGSTLADVSKAINSSTAGISAAIVNDGTNQHLVLTADDTGLANTIKITGSDVGGGTGWAGGSFDYATTATNSWTQSKAASNATLQINGIDVTSASNSLSSAISGVTLNLTKAGSTSLTVTRDTSGLATAVNSFVTAYNQFNTTATNLGSYNATTKAAGSLNGDSTLRSSQRMLRSLLSTIPSELSGAALQNLSDIGISVQKDGSLAVDSGKLTKAISGDFTGVSNLLTAYGTAFKKTTDGLIGTDGLIAARTDGITASIKSITKQEEALSARLTNIEARYLKQYNALDSLMSSMTTTTNYLTQQLDSLAALRNNK